MKKILNLVYWGILIIILLIAGVLVLSTFDTPLNIRVFSVQSGSMEPAIRLGSLVVVRGSETYGIGDIVTVVGERTVKETVTHRIAERVVDPDNGRVSYRLKGDVNEEADRELVPSGRVIGKVIFSMPYVGYLVSFVQSQVGFMALIIIPATILIYSELMVIKKEIRKMFFKKRKKADEDMEEEEEDE